MKTQLKNILERTDTKSGKYFSLFVQSMVILSLITYSIGTLPNLSSSFLKQISIVETTIIAIFTIEYIARIYVADKKLKFCFSFFGIIDLLAILPFYISTGIDLRSIRAFRLFKLVKIMKLMKYSNAIQRLHRALIIAKEELILFCFVTAIILYLSAVGIYHFENPVQPDAFKSVFHSLWWAITTLTTVGYGDMYPITNGGKIFTFFVLIIGLGIVAIPTGLIASALSQAREEAENKNT